MTQHSGAPSGFEPTDLMEVRASMRFIVASLVGGLIAVSCGLALELYAYRQFEDQLRDVPFRYNGWLFVGLGGIFTWIGLRGLVLRPILLRLDSSGVHSPKQNLFIPWDQIQGVRGVVTGGGGGRYLGVSVTSPGEIRGGTSSRRVYWAVLKEFSQEEIPIGMTGGEICLESAVAAIEAYRARRQPRSDSSLDVH